MRQLGKATRLLGALGALVWLNGCEDDDGTGPGRRGIELPAFAGIVSDPAGALSQSLVGDSVTYVSLVPGTVVRGSSIEIRNLTSGFTRTELLVGGGLDPVPVPASVGDTLQLTVTNGSEITVRALVVVAPRRPPRVVRTEPPPKKRDVVLNARMLVVFSEPVDPATVSATNIRLMRGGVVVNGQVTLAADGLSATFRPDAPLQPTADYTLAVTAAVADLDGDSLEAPVTVPFTTGTLPPPSGVLAFTDGANISLMTADGTFITRLTSDSVPFVLNADAAWSRDGSRIAFSRYSGGYYTEIYVMNADGTNQVRLSPLGAYEAHPTWSPDGSRIAFENRPDPLHSNGDIYVMNADGTNRVRLTTHFNPDWSPAWSPDGNRIAFTGYTDRGISGIFVINADGSNRVALTNDSTGGVDIDPAWSPDGSRIVFSRQGDLFIVNADGTNLVRLTTGLLGAAQPTWSPDGLFVAYTQYSGCEYPEVCPGPRLWMVRVTDGLLLPLSPLSIWALYPSWQP